MAKRDAPPPMDQLQTLLAAYLRKRQDLVRFFTARTRSSAAAEDLVQDIYLKLKTREAPADLQNPEAYLYRLGTNLMLDRLKERRRRQQRETSWVRESTGVGDDAEPVADETPADEALASRQRLARLVGALDRLPAKTKQAFKLHKFEGLSHKEVAAQMGVSRSAVEKYLMAALRTLAAELDE